MPGTAGVSQAASPETGQPLVFSSAASFAPMSMADAPGSSPIAGTLTAPAPFGACEIPHKSPKPTSMASKVAAAIQDAKPTVLQLGLDDVHSHQGQKPVEASTALDWFRCAPLTSAVFCHCQKEDYPPEFVDVFVESQETVHAEETRRRRDIELEAELQQRREWDTGSVVEVYSSSLGRWNIGLVEAARDQFLVVRFMGDDGNMLAKNLAPFDMQLARFGKNVRSLPVGFIKVPSTSRKNQVAYMEVSTTTKFINPALAWRHHLERLLDPNVKKTKYANLPEDHEGETGSDRGLRR